jgi:hypothetical protein
MSQHTSAKILLLSGSGSFVPTKVQDFKVLVSARVPERVSLQRLLLA